MKNAGKYLLAGLAALSIACTASVFLYLNRDMPDISASYRPTISQDTHNRININTADKQTLMTLPGIGEKLAQAIIDYRTEQGPFSGVSDLLNVEGLGSGKLEAILDRITVGG